MAKIQDIRHRTQRTNGTRSLSQIKYIVRHHSATPTGDFDSVWKYWHGTKGWGTGGYHEIILRDGTVQLCYDPNEITNGVGNYNTPTYHICLVGNGSFTAAQEKAWDERVAYNMKRLGIGVNNVKGHREMPGANTTCPGINMNTVRARIRGGAVTPNQPAPAPSKPSNPSKPKGKTISQMADEVIAGKHGQGHSARRKSLGISQAEYEKVRAEVNRRLGASTSSGSSRKSISQMAQEIIDGKHGNGNEARRKSLGISKSEYEKVRAEVNRRLGVSAQKPKPKPKKTIAQMAQEVIDGKHGTGHENRRRSLGIDKAAYEKVRAEVNRRLTSKSAPKKKTKSISQMATEVIQGKHGKGHEQRRKSLGIDKATYDKVRAEVNRRLRK